MVPNIYRYLIYIWVGFQISARNIIIVGTVLFKHYGQNRGTI